MNPIAYTARDLANRQHSVNLPPTLLQSASNYREAVSRVTSPVLVKSAEQSSVQTASEMEATGIKIPEIEWGMYATLWDLLPFSRIPVRTRSLEKLLRAYMQSLEVLRIEGGRTLTFMNNATYSMIEVRGAMKRRATELVDLSEKALRAGLNFQPVLAPTIVTADLAAHSLEVVRQQLEADLQHKAAKIVRHFYSLLLVGVERNLFGLVTWMNPTTCRFTHCTAPIVLVNSERRSEERWDGRMETRTVDEYQHRLGVREHHLVRAHLVAGIPAKAFIPPDLHQLIDVIPRIARPFVATLDGLLIRERALEWEIFQSSVESEVHLEPLQRTPDWDPAIVLGPIVLTAWTERDFPRAVSTRDKLQRLWRWLCRPTDSINR